MSGEATARVRVRVEGTVQGVGFRPFVFRLATEEQLSGHVLNDSRGVELEAEGSPAGIERLITRLRRDAPPLALVERVLTERIAPTGATGFEIRESGPRAPARTSVGADAATCERCLAEILDPADRRYRYPFTNCTDCGPRLTIVDGVPYDRARTTMAGFTMCAPCRREYEDPGDRRFHAQPNACPACGPRARLIDGSGEAVSVPAAIDAVDAGAALLAAGRILAVKGLGGYHLAALADVEATVAELRARKHREHKPFALMVAGLPAARRLATLDPEAERMLSSPARPIVLAPRRADAAVAASVAPGNPELGVMLAYTPLHHLLLADLARRLGAPAALVMTSGNVSDEPIAFVDGDAIGRLAPVADALLVHDRPIRSRVDDSVLRTVAGVDGPRPQMLRRSRGYVPAPLTLPLPLAPGRALLACGPDLKNTFCLARGAQAWLSHHIGDLEHFDARASYVDGIAHLRTLLDIEPEVVVHDLHPGYASTAYAQSLDGVEFVGVQHHHAHLAGCLAEHGRGGAARAVGAIFDGTGYGTDGTVWGGEILCGGLSEFTRVACLHPVTLPGGEAAIREPWRMARVWLAAATGETGVPVPAALREVVDAGRWRAVGRIAADPSLSPVTTSVGRLFDAVAALCAIAPQVSYEGQAAVELTAAAARAAAPRAYELMLSPEPGEPARLDPRAMVAAIARDAAAGVPIPDIAAGFHRALAAGTGDACAWAASAQGVDTVVLSGGVFQNRSLLELTGARLRRAGLRVLTPELVPPGDGGIAFGQAAVAAARLAAS